MSKVKKAIKSVAKVVNKVVPNEIKPIAQAALALIPGIGPAISAAYTAVDAYGGGASLGKSLGAGAKSFAISQVSGAASKALGISSTGNDLTDLLGTTKNDGILGLGSGAADGVAKTGQAAAASAVSPKGISTSPAAAAAEKGVTGGVPSMITGETAKAASTSLIDKLPSASTAAGVAGAGLAAASLLTGSPKIQSAANPSGMANADDVKAAAAEAANEELRRKRKGAQSNIATSPLGLYNPGQTAAQALLG
jgi:hypothetical protein